MPKRETPSMTRQDFEFIADVINSLNGPTGFSPLDIEVIAGHFTNALKVTNGAFKPERFYERATKNVRSLKVVR